MNQPIDQAITQLIPHRPPMLLINQLLEVDQSSASALVKIADDTAFLQRSDGQTAFVPAWIGVEYMGQTAALIAGFQEQQGLCEPHLGFLMGARKYQSNVSQFVMGSVLKVSCREAALVGESLAMFKCTIAHNDSGELLASASLTVYRRALNQS